MLAKRVEKERLTTAPTEIAAAGAPEPALMESLMNG
jgi:hypothetical protein